MPFDAVPVQRLWVPKRVLATPAALSWPQGLAMAERAAALGAEVVRLKSDRLTGLPDTYRDAKSTLAIVVSPPGKRRPQPIPPSADWRFDLAAGCPAHCQYCYLAGSLAGPPIIRAYANLPEILAELPPLLGLPHGRRTRIRFSVNAAGAERFEGGAPRMAQRLSALRQVALAGYRIGLTVAPIMPVPDWQAGYDRLLADCAAALAGVPDPDLTVELITHRFTEGSRRILQGWYPGSALDLDPDDRSRKTTKFGGVKYVFPRERMTELRTTLEASVARHLPAARLLYWT